MSDKILAIINHIKTYNSITDLNISYNIDTEKFLVFDSKKRLIRSVVFSMNEFKEFLDELTELSLWKNDYEFNLKVLKY